MTVAIKVISVTDSAPEEMSRRGLRRASKTAFQAIAEHWQDRMLPSHFRPDARHRYGHQPRSRKYLAKKHALARHGVVQDGGRSDNVFRGVLRRLLLRHHVVRAYPTRATINLIGPSYFTTRPRRANMPRQAMELTTINAAEDRTLTQVADRALTRAIAAQKRTKRRRTK